MLVVYFKKKLSTLMTGQSIPEYYLWLWKSLELKFLRGCHNILDNVITCVCLVPFHLHLLCVVGYRARQKSPVGIWTATSKLPGVWSPPDNQPRPCEKATTALWKEECFCSVSSYHCCVCALCLAYAAFPREASALFLYAYVRLSPCR